MTKAQIKQIANQHGVPDVFIRGRNIAEMLQHIDSYYTRIVGYMTISYYPDASKHQDYIDTKAKRDALRVALGINS